MLSKQGDAKNSKHYQQGDVQPIDLIVAQKLPFIEGSIVKYICRYRHKGTTLQDLLKVKQYVDWLIEIQKGQCNENRSYRSNR